MLDKLDVLIADDHPLFREALTDVVRQICRDYRCLEACSLEETRSLATVSPDLDLILLDLMMPGMDGNAGLRALRHDVPAVPIVVVSAKTERSVVLEAIRDGAIGFITKTSPRGVMVEALMQVMAGGIYLPPEVVRQFDAETGAGTAAVPRVPRDVLTTLTRKQLLVLERLARGESNKQIARALSLAEPTVKAHVSAILRKLNVRSRANAIVASNGIDFSNLLVPRDGERS
ncbi:MAG: response regulator [Alphaproteobacteria bacterium]|jgi:DNA-binding NarL/FixJ family response regulator|nr:response regulator [Alphaproteobacteria bacterium]